MIKIFTTQLIGRLKMMEEKEINNLEDAARLLAQALVGEGDIYIYAEQGLDGVLAEALHGMEPLERVRVFDENSLEELSHADRVILFVRHLNDEKALQIGEALHKKGVPFAAAGALGRKEENKMDDWAYVSINLQADQGLVPTFTGRSAFIHQIASLYVYQSIKLLLDEIIEDY